MCVPCNPGEKDANKDYSSDARQAMITIGGYTERMPLLQDRSAHSIIEPSLGDLETIVKLCLEVPTKDESSGHSSQKERGASASAASRIAEGITRIKATASPDLLTELSTLGEGAMDCCGTGGSGKQKFNTSTTSAFIIAAAGVKVTKFGNRSATGKSGSVDFLERIGIPANLSPFKSRSILDHCGLLFLNAREVFPALKDLGEIRKKLGKPTLLNYMGPLLNPCDPTYRLIGSSNSIMLHTMAEYLISNTSTRKALLVSSSENLDELDPFDTNFAIEIERKQDERARLRAPRQIRYSDSLLREKSQSEFGNFAIEKPGVTGSPNVQKPTDVSGSRFVDLVSENAELFNQIVSGVDTSTPAYHTVVLNSGAALCVAGLCSSIDEGMDGVKELLSSGAVMEQYRRTRRTYDECVS